MSSNELQFGRIVGHVGPALVHIGMVFADFGLDLLHQGLVDLAAAQQALDRVEQDAEQGCFGDEGQLAHLLGVVRHGAAVVCDVGDACCQLQVAVFDIGPLVRNDLREVV